MLYLHVEFEMSDLGLMHYFLGIEVVQSANGYFISQKKVCPGDLKQISDAGLQSYK